MKKLVVLAACLFALSSSISLEAKAMKIGTFKIDGSIHHRNFILEDGNVYKPISGHERENCVDWELGDSILVLKSSKTNRYILVNTRTGQKCKTKIVSINSSSSS